MQNIGVSTTPDKPNPPNRKPRSRPEHDYFLEPLPVPEATESSTDTAWNLWEHTLRGDENPSQLPPDSVQPGFEDTEAAGSIPPREKP